jgi:hypothetical protein
VWDVGCGMRGIKIAKSKARAMRFRGCLVTDGWAKRALVGWLVGWFLGQFAGVRVQLRWR